MPVRVLKVIIPPHRSTSAAEKNDTSNQNVNTVRGSAPKGNKTSTSHTESVPHNDVAILIEEVRLLRKQVQDLKYDNVELKEEIKTYHQVLNKTLNEHSTKLDAVDREMSDLRGTVTSLPQDKYTGVGCPEK